MEYGLGNLIWMQPCGAGQQDVPQLCTDAAEKEKDGTEKGERQCDGNRSRMCFFGGKAAFLEHGYGEQAAAGAENAV